MPDLQDIPGLAWLRSATLGTTDVRVALLDGPVDTSHECFVGAALERVEGHWLPPAAPVNWTAEHATGIASILIGQPGSSVEGIAPGIHLVAMTTGIDEETAGSEIVVAQAIEAALERKSDVIHCAYCLPSQSSTVGDLLTRALAKAADADVLVVAPAGNTSGDWFCAPADQPSVLAVGGLDDDGSVRGASSHGPAYDGHGVMAWSENLLTATPGGGTNRQAGTSGAAPQVTGVAALLLSLAREQGMDPSPIEVGRLIRETARPIEEAEQRARAIGGVLDPRAAARALLGESVDAGVEPSLRLPSRLFALGQVTVDLATEAARERLAARMEGDVDDVRDVAAHLAAEPGDASLVTWVLAVDGTPRYALEPTGPAAAAVDERLVQALLAGEGARSGQDSAERTSVPGTRTVRSTTLRRGQRVPVVAVSRPDTINAWRTADLAAVAVSTVGGDPTLLHEGVVDVLSSIYDRHRNDGTLGRDRALNYAGTNAVQAAMAVAQATSMGLTFDRLDVAKGRFDRPYSECWDVLARFRDPDDPYRAPRVWVWTVDVAADTPVAVGMTRSWAVTH